VTVLVVGAGGQLGQDLLEAFPGTEVVGVTREQLDLTDADAVARTVAQLAPTTVVNAGAWTDVDGCESDPLRAHRVNALGPWHLARACAQVGARLVHVSTDYVFDGGTPTRGDGTPRGLTEFDPVAPINEYGRSKAAGEELVRRTLDDHVIVRTAWVCGARGRNFVTTMLRLARERDHVAVVDDQTGTPTFTRDLAAAIRELVDVGITGTINRTNTGRATWFDLAAATFELADLEVDLRRQPSSALQRPAPRPGWSVLDPLHADALGLTPLPHWRDGLGRMLEELHLGVPGTSR
jgi:dTDP-4-dehydrorhamnose reductase